RLRTYHQPIDWDVAVYSIVADELRHGARLYEDIWDNKPPAVFVTFAAAQSLAGNGFGAIYLLEVLAASATLIAIYAAGARYGVGAGLAAAAFWAIVCGDMQLAANRPNTEAF